MHEVQARVPSACVWPGTGRSSCSAPCTRTRGQPLPTMREMLRERPTILAGEQLKSDPQDLCWDQHRIWKPTPRLKSTSVVNTHGTHLRREKRGWLLGCHPDSPTLASIDEGSPGCSPRSWPPPTASSSPGLWCRFLQFCRFCGGTVSTLRSGGDHPVRYEMWRVAEVAARGRGRPPRGEWTRGAARAAGPWQKNAVFLGFEN